MPPNVCLFKVEVHVNPSAPPSFLLSDLKPEHLEHLKVSCFCHFKISVLYLQTLCVLFQSLTCFSSPEPKTDKLNVESRLSLPFAL